MHSCAIVVCVPCWFTLLQDDLQAQITGALGQLSRASELLTTHADPSATAQLDDLLDEVIRQQNEISDKHAALAELTGGDASRTMNLGITGAVARQATQRCTSLLALGVAARGQQIARCDVFCLLCSRRAGSQQGDLLRANYSDS